MGRHFHLQAIFPTQGSNAGFLHCRQVLLPSEPPGKICIYLTINSVEHFSCAYWPSICLLWRNVYLDLLPFFNWVVWFILLLSCMSCLYILGIKPLLVASFANIVSQSVGCLFILFMVSFAVQKLIRLIRSHGREDPLEKEMATHSSILA